MKWPVSYTGLLLPSCTLKRCIKASYSGPGNSCLCILYNCRAWRERLHPSWKLPQSPLCGCRRIPRTHACTHTHTHTPIQHDPAAACLSPAWKAMMTNRCCHRNFFLLFFLSPSSHWAFFPQPWHKTVKWCSTAEFNFTVQLGPWLHCQIQINVHLTNMDHRNSGWQPAVIRAIDSCVEFYVLSTPAHHWWNWLIKWIYCYNYL